MIPSRRTLPVVVTVAVAAAALVTSCSSSESSSADENSCATLDSSLEWYGDNRERLQEIIAANSPCAGTWSGTNKPVAIFDWDNTVVKNDIGYATNYWMLMNDKVLQPAGADWRNLDKYLTTAGADALRDACGTDVAPGAPLPTSANTRCADEILAVLDDETTSGAQAFEGYNPRRTLGDYEFSASLGAGYTPAQLADFAKAAKERNLSAAEGAEDTVGTRSVDGYVRVYPQIKDLISVLQGNGVDTWIVSASPEPIVGVWAPEVGIAADHIVGIRSALADGKITPNMQACGGTSDVITYVDGKRCWANQVIFGIEGEAAWEQAPADVRQIFAAGDSTTDVTFVGDATRGHLVVNRNKTELMCLAYDNHDGNWVINPMFIGPKAEHKDPYSCSTAGVVDAAGHEVPMTRADGSIVPDQADTVHG